MKRVPISAWLVLCIAVMAYALTAAPSIYGIHSDTLEFQVVGPIFGIAHPTGYPLYSILSGVWSRVLFPVGNWAWRMNLFSAITGGLTIFVLFLVCYRLVGGTVLLPRSIEEGSTTKNLIGNRYKKLTAKARRRESTRRTAKNNLLLRRRKDARLRLGSAEQVREEKQNKRTKEDKYGSLISWIEPASGGHLSATIAVTVAALFGLGTIWWSQTTIAEVYSLHALFVATILYVTIRTPLQKNNEPALGWLFLLIGLSLAHHRTTVLILPGIAIYLLLTVPNVLHPSRKWIGWIAALLAPLLLYGYILIRAAMGAADLSGLYTNSWVGFWDHVLARGFNEFFADNALAIERSFTEWLALVQSQIGLLGIVFAVVGIGQLFVQGGGADQGKSHPKESSNNDQRAAWLLVLITLIANLIFVLLYRVGDIEVFLLPVLLCATILAGGGIALIARVGATVDQRANVWIARAALILLLLPSLYSVAQNWGDLNRSQAWREHNQAVAVAKVAFPPNSQLIGLEGEISALTYMQRAAGLAANATGLIARGGDESARIERIRAHVAAGDPVYLTREVPGIGTSFSFSSDGPLIRVWPRGAADIALPESAYQPSDALIANGTLMAEGVEIVRLDQPGERGLRVTFYWFAREPIAERLKLSLRLQNGEGEPMRNADGTRAVEDRFPLRQATYTEEWVVGERIRDVHYLTIPADADSQNGSLLVVIYNALSGEEVGRLTVPLSP